MEIMERIVMAISRDLRCHENESYYKTAQECGMRSEVVKKLEDTEIKGSAAMLCRYIDTYCKRYPSRAYKMFYNASIAVAQSNINWND